MKHKTTELEGALLDAAVAKAEGKPYVRTLMPSSVWEDGGPIIERERITLNIEDDDQWEATVETTYNDKSVVNPYMRGRTPLIAAMRAFCASRFGEEVEL